MTWRGYDKTTPVDDTPGALTAAYNVRLGTDDEVQRRRGLARTSIAQVPGAIKGMSDLSFSTGNPYVLTSHSGTIDGFQGISSQWDDATLMPVGGRSRLNPDGVSYSLVIDRFGYAAAWATSVAIYAKAGVFPSDESQGTYVGEFDFVNTAFAYGYTLSTTWTPPSPGTWYFRAYGIRDRELGPGRNLVRSAYMYSTLVTDGYVSASAMSGTVLYIAGGFTTVTGTNGVIARNNCAAVDLSDGSVLAFNPNVNAGVRALAFLGSTLYIGGLFTAVGGVTRNAAAAVDGTTGALVNAWNPNIAGGLAQIFGIGIDSSLIYLVGDYTTTAGTARGRGCCYNTAGTLQAWDPLSNARIYTIAFDSTRAFLGGAPMTINGVFRGSLAAVDKTTGAYDASFTPLTATGGTNFVQGMTILNSILYFCGIFTAINATTRNNLGAASLAGVLQAWDPNANGQTIGIDSDDDDIIYVNGAFTTMGGAAHTYCAAIQTDGTVLPWATTGTSGSDGLAVYPLFQIVVDSAANQPFVNADVP